MEFWTTYTLTTHDHGPLALAISTEDDSATAFTKGFKLDTLKAIDDLWYINAWFDTLTGGRNNRNSF
jgi:hypothetical protein